MLKPILIFTFIFSCTLQCFCQKLTDAHKGVKVEINSLNDSEVDSLVNDIYDNLEINDSLNMYELMEALKMGDIYDSLGVIMNRVINKTDWNDALKDVNWNELVREFDWSHMVDSMCVNSSGGEPDIPNTDKSSSDIMEDLDLSNAMECMKGNMRDMMEAMDQMCIMQKMIQGKIKLSTKPQDIRGFCEMVECIDIEKYFSGFDWNCFYKSVDLNPIFRNIDFKPWVDSLKTYRAGGGDTLMLKDYQKGFPMLEGIDFSILQEQVNVELESILSNSDFTRVYKNLYDKVIRKDLLKEEEEEDLEKIILLSFAMMKNVFKEPKDSRALKYYITHLWLIYETAEKFRHFQFDEALPLLELQKNIILITVRDSLFDSKDINNDAAKARVILGPNYELNTLAGTYQQIADVHIQLGHYTDAGGDLNDAIKIRKDIIGQLSEKKSAQGYLALSFTDKERKALTEKYQFTYDVMQLSTNDLLYGRHPAIIRKLLEFKQYSDANIVYQLFQDSILIRSRANQVLPEFVIQNKLIDRTYALKLLKNIYRNRVKIMNDAIQEDHSNWKLSHEIIKKYEKAPDALENLEQRQWLALLYAQIGYLDLLTGSYELALFNLGEAWHRLSRIENLDYLNYAFPGSKATEKEYLNKMPFYVGVAQNLAILRINRKEFGLAIQILEEAQEVLADKERFLGYKRGSQDYNNNLFNIYGTLGDVYLQIGDTLAAAQQFKKCKLIANITESELLIMRYNFHQSSYCIKRKDYKSAIKHFRSADSLSQIVGNDQGQAIAKTRLGAINQRLGNQSGAIKQYVAAEKIAKRLSQYSLLIEIYTLRGLLAQDSKKIEEAQEWFDKGINIIEKDYFKYSQGNMSRQLVLEKAEECYAGAITTALDLGQKEKAFRIIQQTKARTLNELLLEGELQKTTGLSDTIKQLKVEKQDVLFGLNSSFNGNAVTKMGYNLDSLRKAKLDELEIVNAKIRQEVTNKNGDKLSYEIPSIKKIQEEISNDEVIVEYFLGQSTYVFIIGKHGFEVIDLGKNEEGDAQINQFVEKIEKMTGKLLLRQESILHAKLLDEIGTKHLYNAFWQPIEESTLLNDVKKLVIIPDAGLYLVPFEALLEGSSGSYLIDQYHINYFPSISSWKQYTTDSLDTSKTYSKPLLALSKSQFEEQSKLQPLNRQALTNIFPETDFLLEEQAHLDSLISKDLTQYRYLYLSTHGLVDPLPEFSYLQLHNSRLSLFQAFELDIDNEVVVLSACETAKGDFRRGAGLMGFTRGLLYAGAESIVISLWKVEEKATEKLMEFFFQALKDGHSPRNALSKAKQQLRQWDKGQYDNPYYWGAFVLFGKG